MDGVVPPVAGRFAWLPALLVGASHRAVALVYPWASAPFVSALHSINELGVMGLTAAIAYSAGEHAQAAATPTKVATAET